MMGIHENEVDILVAEDSRTQAESLMHILNSHGYQVRIAQNGLQALALMKEKTPTILISDVVMPQMNGYELCQHMRNDVALNNIPIILLTSLSDVHDVVRGLECGANNFVTKPYERIHLLSRIEAILLQTRSIASEQGSKEAQITIQGHRYLITANKQQILDLLVSTYEAAMQKNHQLTETQLKLQELNNLLEEKVVERTQALQLEIEERKHAQQQLSIQYALVKVLAESSSLKDAAPQILQILHRNLGCDASAIWCEDKNGISLSCLEFWHSSNLSLQQLATLSKQTVYKRSTSKQTLDLIYRAWLGGNVEKSIIEPLLETGLARLKVAHEAKLHTWAVFPITLRGKVPSVIELFWSHDHPVNEQLLSMVQMLGPQMGQFIGKKQLEQQLLHAQKMESIGNLTGGLAHDFNNLLMVIQNNLELLSNEFPENGKQKQRAQAAISATERGADLVNRLLAFSRNQALQCIPVDLRSLISDTIKLLKPTLGKSIEIVYSPPTDLWPVHTDPAQLESALINLAVNARDAMEGKGKLTFSCMNIASQDITENIMPGDYIKISVIDQGSGIPPEILDRIFEPFFTTKEAGKGTGLGLSMVYGFIQQSKGQMTIFSEPGQGTTINLYLPRESS